MSSIKTPVNNLSVSGTFNLYGDAAITGNIVLGNTFISEQGYLELIQKANRPGIPGPVGASGQAGPAGPAGILRATVNNNITTSILGSGAAGDLAVGGQNGSFYLYVCYDNGNWGRIPLDIGF